MDRFSVKLDFDFTLYYAEPQDKRIQPIVHVNFDTVLAAPAMQVHFPVDVVVPASDSKKTSNNKNLATRRSPHQTRLEYKGNMILHNGGISVNKNSYYFKVANAQRRPQDPPFQDKHIPHDSCLVIYIFTTEYDDFDLTCHMPSLSATVNIERLYNNKTVTAVLCDSEQKQCGTVTVAPHHAKLEPDAIDLIVQNIVSKSNITEPKQITSIKQAFEAEKAIVLSEGCSFKKMITFTTQKHNSPSVKQDKSVSESYSDDSQVQAREEEASLVKKITEQYRSVHKQWRQDLFVAKEHLSHRIMWFMDCNIAGPRINACYVISDTVQSNKEFWLNMFCNVMRRFAIRDGDMLKGQNVLSDDFVQLFEGSWKSKPRIALLCNMFMGMSYAKKEVVMTRMFSEIANKVRYVTDHMRSKSSNGKYVVVEMMENCSWVMSGDCEDMSSCIKSVITGLLQCQELDSASLDMSLYKPLVVLKAMAKCYIDLMVLARVTTKNIQGASGVNEPDTKSINAHMAVLCMPLDKFARVIRAFHQQKTLALSLSEALEKELKEFKANMDTLCGLLKVTSADIEQRMLIVEGTGNFYPVEATNPLAVHYEYIVDKSNSIFLSFASEMVYHKQGHKSQFYLNFMTASTDRFLVRYGVPCASFVFSHLDSHKSNPQHSTTTTTTTSTNNKQAPQDKRNTSTSILQSMLIPNPQLAYEKPEYGSVYSDTMNGTRPFYLVCFPALTDQEVKLVARDYKYKQSMPLFKVNKMPVETYESMGQQDENMVNMFETGAIEYEMSNFVIEGAKKDKIPEEALVNASITRFKMESNKKDMPVAAIISCKKGTKIKHPYLSLDTSDAYYYNLKPKVLSSMTPHKSALKNKTTSCAQGDDSHLLKIGALTIDPLTGLVVEDVSECGNIWETIRLSTISHAKEIRKQLEASFLKKRREEMMSKKATFVPLVYELDSRAFQLKSFREDLVRMVKSFVRICRVDFYVESVVHNVSNVVAVFHLCE
jgi:hypothetical protein